MSLKVYLTLMTFATAIAWFGFIFVLSVVNPETTNWIGFTLFYLSLFIAIAGSAAVVGFLIRFIAMRRAFAMQAARAAFRQSFFLAFFVVIALLLLSKNLFSWLNIFLLAAGLSILEFFFLACAEKISPSMEDEQDLNK